LDAVQSRFFNMLMTPRALLGDPVALPRVRDHLRTHPDVAAPARGPDRPEFERLVTSRPGHTVTHEEERP
jgi:hypothetical protein